MVRSFLLGAVVAGTIAFGSSAVAAGFGGDDTDFYLGFGLAPAFGSVADFYAEVPGAADSALPYRKDAIGGGETSPFDFDWEGSGTKGSKYPIKFQHSSPFGVVGSVGVRYSTGRLELEAVRERFPIMKVSGRAWTKGDSMFLLVDDAIVRLVTGQIDSDDPAAAALRALSSSTQYGELHNLADALSSEIGARTGRGDLKHVGASSVDALTATKLVAAALGHRHGRRVAYPTAMKKRAMILLSAAARVKSADIVKKRSMILTALGRIGGYKIEIPAVAANTFGANYCYDVSTVNMGGLSPYGCVGIGMSFLKVAKTGTPRFTYGAKLGVSYELSPQASIFVDGAYRRVMEYKEQCRVSTLSAASGHREYTEEEDVKARVSFGLHYLALEAGLRFILA
ncbi:P44/Msp2 family outer membrane protein [Anaplasma marginale]|uniref:P44/Msp2 family outer membrane protein n=1 Tax=Anaplasma marginale TaxID=770 RepID=A0A643CMB8_ANAMA|nr:P44/Msp2 family outer membrane protein [Anaplasma marginale]KAA8475024.1 P44/Msp2 family outer membrane protein [Anaplasma marginale]KAB0452520.1 P44/Msp2 family outer membrane protein [Anaplasma marginale]